MKILQAALFGAAVFVVTASAATAGPCADAIDAMQGRIDAALEAKAAAGPTGKEGVPAGMSVQPTPRSIAAAEEKLGDISPQTIAASVRAWRKRAAPTLPAMRAHAKRRLPTCNVSSLHD